jgi:hypothetical protein
MLLDAWIKNVEGWFIIYCDVIQIQENLSKHGCKDGLFISEILKCINTSALNCYSTILSV